MFGDLSKAERRRVQHRTRAAMMALAGDGRWLGGRPNYGYRLVDTGLPHPNRSKASAGAQLRTLDPDPETAPVVRRIFDLYDAGVGFRSIAQALESEASPARARSVPSATPDRPASGAAPRCGPSSPTPATSAGRWPAARFVPWKPITSVGRSIIDVRTSASCR